MTKLKGRLGRLERRVEAASVCPACEDKGYPSTVVDFAGQPPKQPGGCHLCGKSRPGLRILAEVPREVSA